MRGRVRSLGSLTRLSLLALILVAIIVLPGASSASHAGSGGQKHDFVVGVSPNEVLLGQAHSSFAADSDALGGNPKGHVTTKGDPDGPGPVEPFKAEGEITCLRVEGNRATYKWRFRRAEGSLAPFQGGGIQAFLEDNGQPRNGVPVDATTVDGPQPAGVFELTASQCEDPDSRVTYDPINSGNFVVHDAVP